MITADRLRELLRYDIQSGQFVWMVNRRGHTRLGDIAGSPQNMGYWSIKIDGTHYLAHRLAWLYVHGGWPSQDIDHINGNRTDNRLVNLRVVSRQVNLQNQRKPKSNNTSGFLGVSKDGKKRWIAQIQEGNNKKYIGSFPNPELAYQAYLEAKRVLHIGCTI